MEREHAFRYIECDIPEGVTLDRWRAARAEVPSRRRLDPLRALRSYARTGSSRRRAPADGV
jgi:hypothetical protein